MTENEALPAQSRVSPSVGSFGSKRPHATVPLRVAFITRDLGKATGGLGRYEEELVPRLMKLVQVSDVPIEPWKVPALLSTLATISGKDLQAALDNHPMVVRLNASCDLVHLSNQTLAGSLHLW